MTHPDPYPSLHQTVRVDSKGNITHGIDVPPDPREPRRVAAPYHVVHTSRFSPGGIPAGVDQTSVNRPHDCANHLPDTEQVLRRGW